MRRIIRNLLILLLILICSNEIGAKMQTVRYYSKKEWVTHYDFFDKDFKDATQITNSYLISANLNGFGPYSFTQSGYGIYPISLENLNGKKPLEVVSSGEHLDFYSTFVINFGANIKINDLKFGVEIKDSNGNLIDYEVYFEKDGYKEVVYSGQDTTIVNLKFDGKEIDAIYIRAKRPANGNIHILKYFKIDEYQVYEHVKWVKDYIPNTEIFDQKYEEAGGDFYPYDGKNIWKKSHSTLFTPSGKMINDDVVKMKKDEWLRYNDGLRIGINKDATPDFEKMYLWNGGDKKLYTTYGYLPSNKPFYWIKDGNSFIAMDKISHSPYVKTNKVLNDRHIYIKVNAVAVHCGGFMCKLASEGGGKVDGHSASDITNNAYDTYVTTYYGEAVESKSYIRRIDFYLTDENGNRDRLIKSVNGDVTDNNLEKLASEVTIEESGKWRIEAISANALNDIKIITSGVFLVDRNIPSIFFNPSTVRDTIDPVNVKIRVKDRHSGVEKWRYALSFDNGKTFGPNSDWIYEESKDITINKTGENVIYVTAIDKAGNVATKKSLVYIITNDPPVLALKDNVYYVDEKVDNKKLIENAVAFDAKDGDISQSSKIIKIEYADGRVVDYPNELDTSIAQKVKITYSVTNSANLSDTKTKEYPIIESGSSLVEIDNDSDIYTRYIDKKYLTSLKDSSIWMNDQEYKRILNDSLNKNTGIVYQVN